MQRDRERGGTPLLRFGLVLIFTLTLISAVQVRAQWSVPGVQEESAPVAPTTQWWDLSKAERCGRRWCSEVFIPYGPPAPGGTPFVVAVDGNQSATAAEMSRLVERRSETIEASFQAVVEQLRRSDRAVSDVNPLDGSVPDLSGDGRSMRWWMSRPKPLHPLAPRMEVGVQNDATVIFAVANTEINLAQQIIATVTDADAQNAGISKQDLAVRWRQDLQGAISDAVWGISFDQAYPYARLLIAAAILAITGMIFMVVSSLGRLLRERYRIVQGKLNRHDARLKEKAMDPQAVSSQPSERKKVIKFRPVSVIVRPRPDPGRHGVADGFRGALQTIKDRLFHGVPRLEMDRRALMRQGQSLVRVLLQMLNLLRWSVLLAGLLSGLLVWPGTRIVTLALAQQAVLIPLIWVMVSISELLIDLLVNRSINLWVRDSVIHHPLSNRYQMRASTYSRVLKGAGRFVCVVIGIYATLMTLGVDPNVLAGAGLLAVAIGFLSRNILEDMMNGALILVADRYAIGDVISVGASSGFVENMDLASTQLRSADGELITIPNNQIRTVANLSKDWSRVNFEVDVSASADLRHALLVIQQVADALYRDPEWKGMILKPAEVLGVDRIAHSGSQVRVWITTSPLNQWAVGREFRLRVKQAFDANGIALGVPQRRLEVDHPQPGDPPTG